MAPYSEDRGPAPRTARGSPLLMAMMVAGRRHAATKDG